MPLDKDVEVLADFGLTANQAKVYLAVVRLGIAPVGRVSKTSGVRRDPRSPNDCYLRLQL